MTIRQLTEQPTAKVSVKPTLEQRRIIYQARRGLKELDMFIDPYIKHHYLHATTAEQQTFAELLTFEDPDLLDYFMNQRKPESAEIEALISKLKQLTFDS